MASRLGRSSDHRPVCTHQRFGWQRLWGLGVWSTKFEAYLFWERFVLHTAHVCHTSLVGSNTLWSPNSGQVRMRWQWFERRFTVSSYSLIPVISFITPFCSPHHNSCCLVVPKRCPFPWPNCPSLQGSVVNLRRKMTTYKMSLPVCSLCGVTPPPFRLIRPPGLLFAAENSRGLIFGFFGGACEKKYSQKQMCENQLF